MASGATQTKCGALVGHVTIVLLLDPYEAEKKKNADRSTNGNTKTTLTLILGQLTVRTTRYAGIRLVRRVKSVVLIAATPLPSAIQTNTLADLTPLSPKVSVYSRISGLGVPPTKKGAPQITQNASVVAVGNTAVKDRIHVNPPAAAQV